MEAEQIRMLAPDKLETLRAAIRGQLTQPGDADYDSARRVYNATIDRRPSLIVRPVDAADVIAAVNFARDQGLPVAIRGGGHNVAGFSTCDDCILIDLSRMKGVRVDPNRRLVRAEGGATWGDVDHATHAFGMAAPGGLISTTGIGGLTLGGGIGHLTRMYGLSIDSLLSADVVTADGKLLIASKDENVDLFWALRGGGGNFGVVTSFEFRLHPVDTVYAGIILYPLEQAREVLRVFRDFILSDPADTTAFFAFLKVPSGPPFPENLHNKTMVGLVVTYLGPAKEAEKALRPLKAVTPAFEMLGPMPFPALQSFSDALLPAGLHNYWKADFMKGLSDEAVEAHLKYGPGVPTVNSVLHIYPINGAVRKFRSDETAFSYRDADFVHIIAAIHQNPADIPRNTEWVRKYWEALHPHSLGGAYVNFLMEEGQERVQSSYRDNYKRLAQIKKKYDPTNLFRMNQNIRPAEQ